MRAVEHMVTVAGGGLQIGAIADCNLASAVADRPTQLELLGNERCRGPTEAEGVGDHLLRRSDRLRVERIARSQQPVAKARLGRVNGIAGGNLLRLQQQPAGADLGDAPDVLAPL